VRLSRFLPAVMVSVFGVALSVFMFFVVYNWGREVEISRFERVAGGLVVAVEKQLITSFSILDSIRGLYAASADVTRADFHEFVEALELERHAQALEWIPRVPKARRPAFERRAREEGFPEFTFTQRQSQGQMVPAGDREEYFPVYFLEPLAGNTAALGFDLASSPVRLAALNQARDKGSMVATGRITLVQETSAQYGILVFEPIYRGGRVPTTVAERRAKLEGFGLGVFRIGELIDEQAEQFGTPERKISVQVLDLSAPVGARLLYPKLAEGAPNADNLSQVQYAGNFDVLGREWSVVVTAEDLGHGERLFDPEPWIVLLVGLFFTGGLVLHINQLANRKAYAEALVETRTVELLGLNSELKRSNGELEQFAYFASHDLQEPLRKISSFCQLIQNQCREKLGEQENQYIDFAVDAAKRMQAIIRDVLTLSRVGRDNAEFQPTDCQALVLSVQEDLEKAIGENDAEILCGPLPTVVGEPNLLKQLFQNLIENAIKYRREVSPRIQISAMPTPGRIRFSVEDNGIGFDPKFVDRIFQMFQRLHHKEQYEGTGIGLAICKKVVEQHGGEIWAESEPGKGSTFHFSLPT